MTEDFTIPSPQRSYVRSNIRKQLRMSSFFNLVLSPTQISTRTIQAIRAGTLPVTAQLLPSFLFPDNHVYDPDDISLNVLRGHVMIRVLFVIYITLIKVNFF